MKVLITGGCGFIGCNAAVRFSQAGHQVYLVDNLSRPCADLNLEYLRQNKSGTFIHEDITHQNAVEQIIKSHKFDVVLHLAAQVAVTTSVRDPHRDFAINALGTLNLLEALRQFSPETIFLNASTNKVYGHLKPSDSSETATRYELPGFSAGISEAQPLDFYSPYGCSKGAADQYTVDYARVFGLRTVNFRQSCIYGLRQFGVEDQGWVAWFAIAHLLNKAITVYGTGKQVRDLLFVDDLISCYFAAIKHIEKAAGHSFNLGGGPDNAISILELFAMFKRKTGRNVTYARSDCRPGDQPVFISNSQKALHLLDWRPVIQVEVGVDKLLQWVVDNQAIFASSANRL